MFYLSNISGEKQCKLREQHKPDEETAEGAAAPKPKEGAAAAAGAGAALTGAPKMKG